MAYYKKVIQSGETVRYLGRLHWIIYRRSLFLCVLGIATSIVYINIGDNDQRNGWFVASVLLFLVAFFLFIPAWFRRATTEIVITNKRIIYKRGWIARRTEEMNISKIETVDVNQTVLGRMFGYGSVLIKGVGSSWEPLRRVASPVGLRNAVVTE